MLSEKKYGMSPFSAIEIYNSIVKLEDITDSAEDVADYIIMLTIARREI
jgi:uncharacterized protein Yka (UPF0111/DUF47 family)